MDRMYVKGGTSLTPMLSISNHLWWSTGSTLSQHTECKLLCLFTVPWRIQSTSSRTDPLFFPISPEKTMKSINIRSDESWAHLAVADLHSKILDALPSQSNFRHFHAVFGKKCSRIIGWCPPLAKPWSASAKNHNVVVCNFSCLLYFLLYWEVTLVSLQVLHV